MAKRWRAGQRGAMTEYALIAIVIGLGALFLASRYGGALGGRYEAAHRQVDATQTGEDTSAPGVSFGPTADQGASAQVEAKPFLTTDAKGNTRVDVGVAEFDLTTVIWLGFAVVVLGIVMTVQIFRAAKKEKKNQGPS